jgi:hypothetical protein
MCEFCDVKTNGNWIALLSGDYVGIFALVHAGASGFALAPLVDADNP